MRRFLYTIGVMAYGLAIRIASLFNEKARKWVRGRRKWHYRMRGPVQGGEWIWIHCASVGEFEQGRNLIDALHAQQPGFRILLTFYSPSGYELRKKYEKAAHVMYLPLDTPWNVKRFLDVAKPHIAILVKYELWLNMLSELRKRNIATYLVSARIGEKSPFLRSYLSPLYKEALAGLRWIYTQDQDTLDRLNTFTETENMSVAGDTRFDRVGTVYDEGEPVEKVVKFAQGHFCIVAGSTWPKDEELLREVMALTEDLTIRWVIAPHEVNVKHIRAQMAKEPGLHMRYSQFRGLKDSHRILWIDNVGMLSRIYRHADCCYIGGGFGTGIHNTLEPAVFGNPVMFGPNHEKFIEAQEMLKMGTAVSVENAEEMARAIRSWQGDAALLSQLREKNLTYTRNGRGATDMIMGKLNRRLERMKNY